MLSGSQEGAGDSGESLMQRRPKWTLGCMHITRAHGAHPKHAAHVCDAGRVETQRLVKRRRFLPSRKVGIRSGARRGKAGREERT